MFVVCFPIAHDKGNVFAVRLVLVHGKDNEHLMGVTSDGKKCLSCAQKRTTNYLFAVKQHKNTPQTIFFAGCSFAVRH
jgi:hypothetical protein